LVNWSPFIVWGWARLLSIPFYFLDNVARDRNDHWQEKVTPHNAKFASFVKCALIWVPDCLSPLLPPPFSPASCHLGPVQQITEGRMFTIKRHLLARGCAEEVGGLAARTRSQVTQSSALTSVVCMWTICTCDPMPLQLRIREGGTCRWGLRFVKPVPLLGLRMLRSAVVAPFVASLESRGQAARGANAAYHTCCGGRSLLSWGQRRRRI